MTYDMDAIIKSSCAMKEAINTVGDRLELPVGWLIQQKYLVAMKQAARAKKRKEIIFSLASPLQISIK